MWRRDAGRCGAWTALWAITALALIGAGSPKKKRSEPPPPKVDEAVTDIAYIASPSDMRVEGVGLVVGLDNTGSDPPASWYRDKLLDDMRKAGVENANTLLADPSVSLVIVRLRIPTGTSTSDRLDVELELPPACGTKSLAGGYLLHCRLKEVMIAGGTAKEGPEHAVAQGPVMIGTELKPNDPKAGRVLGGAHVKKDVPFSLVIKDKRRSFRTAALLQTVINQRFPLREGVEQKGVANAKTDQYIVLKVPPVYHHNQFRYFRVVKLLPVVDTPALRAQRMAAWGKELLDPKKAGIAALRLEGLGITAIDTLKAALASPNSQVRFLAAEALAYLNDASGAEVLAATAIAQPEFRAYALAALSATDQSASRMKLIKLMDIADVEVRYGAFDALRKIDETDPFLGRVRVVDEPPLAEDSGESMAVAIAGASRRRRALAEDPFALYVVDCEGPPLLHLARTRRCEIVVFGKGQKLLTPIVLGNGPILLNAADGDESLQISRIASSRSGEPDSKVSASLDLADVLRRTANLGARYPDLVTILQSAARQKNLPGPLVVDAVPGPNPVYTEAAILGKDTTAKKDDALQKTKAEETKRPGLFGRVRGYLRPESTAAASPAKDKVKDKDASPAKDPNSLPPATPDPAAKRDDAVQKTALKPPAEPSLLDRLFRRTGR